MTAVTTISAAPRIEVTTGQVTIDGWTPQRVRDEWASYEKAQRMPADRSELTVIPGVGKLMLADDGKVWWQPLTGAHPWRVLQSA